MQAITFLAFVVWVLSLLRLVDISGVGRIIENYDNFRYIKYRDVKSVGYYVCPRDEFEAQIAKTSLPEDQGRHSTWLKYLANTTSCVIRKDSYPKGTEINQCLFLAKSSAPYGYCTNEKGQVIGDITYSIMRVLTGTHSVVETRRQFYTKREKTPLAIQSTDSTMTMTGNSFALHVKDQEGEVYASGLGRLMLFNCKGMTSPRCNQYRKIFDNDLITKYETAGIAVESKTAQYSTIAISTGSALFNEVLMYGSIETLQYKMVFQQDEWLLYRSATFETMRTHSTKGQFVAISQLFALLGMFDLMVPSLKHHTGESRWFANSGIPSYMLVTRLSTFWLITAQLLYFYYSSAFYLAVFISNSSWGSGFTIELFFLWATLYLILRTTSVGLQRLTFQRCLGVRWLFLVECLSDVLCLIWTGLAIILYHKPDKAMGTKCLSYAYTHCLENVTCCTEIYDFNYIHAFGILHLTIMSALALLNVATAGRRREKKRSVGSVNANVSAYAVNGASACRLFQDCGTTFEKYCAGGPLNRVYADKGLSVTSEGVPPNLVRACGFLHVEDFGLIRSKDLYLIALIKYIPSPFFSSSSLSLTCWPYNTKEKTVQPAIRYLLDDNLTSHPKQINICTKNIK